MEENIVGISNHNVGALVGPNAHLNVGKYALRAPDHGLGHTAIIDNGDGYPTPQLYPHLQYRAALTGQNFYVHAANGSFTDMYGMPVSPRTIGEKAYQYGEPTVVAVPYMPTTMTDRQFWNTAARAGLSTPEYFGLPSTVSEMLNHKGRFYRFVESYFPELNIPDSEIECGAHFAQAVDGMPYIYWKLLDRLEMVYYAESQGLKMDGYPAGYVIRQVDSNGGDNLTIMNLDPSGRTCTVITDHSVDYQVDPRKLGGYFNKNTQYIVGGQLEAVDNMGVSALLTPNSTNVCLPNDQLRAANGACIGTSTLGYDKYQGANEVQLVTEPVFQTINTLARNYDPGFMGLMNLDTMNLSHRQMAIGAVLRNSRFAHMAPQSSVVLVESNPRLTNWTASLMSLSIIMGTSLNEMLQMTASFSPRLQVNNYDYLRVNIAPETQPEDFYNDFLNVQGVLDRYFGGNAGAYVRMVPSEVNSGMEIIGLTAYAPPGYMEYVNRTLSSQLRTTGISNLR